MRVSTGLEIWEETAISVHLYGPQIGEIDGRDYDPSRDHVCDRWGSSEQ
jgi:hypothetical protein